MLLAARSTLRLSMNLEDLADSALAFVKEDTPPENSDRPSEPLSLKVPDANVIIRSSDQVNFRVHKSLLAMSSSLFDDLFSLPQPPDGEIVDGLPVVQLPEDANLLNILVSLIYPVPPVIPGSYEKSYIRDEIKRGRFPMPVGTEAFRTYAIASNMGLILEMEGTGRLTLGHPMTFESLGEGLREFNGRALRDLVRYRVENKKRRFKGWNRKGNTTKTVTRALTSRLTWSDIARPRDVASRS
ncbi:hypothetical protein EDB86DRAFT_1772940 [Lactarius hatsudake]|nr:hypothetical protein EDB86DRAFT_1772940 [Lactarius hatsudake]